jgi:hypothetical protein
LAVAVERGETAEVEMMIDVAEQTDPDGFLGFWELVRGDQTPSRVRALSLADSPDSRSDSFVVAWRPLDDARDVIQVATDLRLLEAYVERGE